ncbi:SDR family NAD(P)-dependent oxidoreductase [Candidatus Pelagibacter sp.]|jgi:3-oxoacyl-[acyl-carrier protein] reductase|nr:SDR family NAD(P)-dependent oxidoreductase [Candidatus Pelagibacter sp.]
MNVSFKGKVVLITGCTKGIGKKLFTKFKSLGAYVIGTSKTIELKRKNYEIIRADFTSNSSTQNFIKILKKIKKIDILINNAGINKISHISKVDSLDVNNIINVNLIAPILITKEVSIKMMKKNKGKIINISSIFGKVSKEKRSVYASTKHAINGLTKTLALDLAANNILVNSVSPGVIETPLTRKVLGQSGIDKMKKEIPLKKLGKTEDVANLILFLASQYNSYITGQNYIIDGGYVVK